MKNFTKQTKRFQGKKRANVLFNFEVSKIQNAENKVGEASQTYNNNITSTKDKSRNMKKNKKSQNTITSTTDNDLFTTENKFKKNNKRRKKKRKHSEDQNTEILSKKQVAEMNKLSNQNVEKQRTENGSVTTKKDVSKDEFNHTKETRNMTILENMTCLEKNVFKDFVKPKNLSSKPQLLTTDDKSKDKNTPKMKRKNFLSVSPTKLIDKNIYNLDAFETASESQSSYNFSDESLNTLLDISLNRKTLKEVKETKKRKKMINSVVGETEVDRDKSKIKERNKRDNLSEFACYNKKVEEEKEASECENVIKTIENEKKNVPKNKSRSKKKKRKDSLGLNFNLDESEIISGNQGEDNNLGDSLNSPIHFLKDVKKVKKRNKIINSIVNDTRVHPEDKFSEKEKKIDNFPEPSKSDKNIREKKSRKPKNVINSNIYETMVDLEGKSPEKKKKKRKKSQSLNSSIDNILFKSSSRDEIFEGEKEVTKQKTIVKDTKVDREDKPSEKENKIENLSGPSNSDKKIKEKELRKRKNVINSNIHEIIVDLEGESPEKKKKKRKNSHSLNSSNILSKSSDLDKNFEGEKEVTKHETIKNQKKNEPEHKSHSKKKKKKDSGCLNFDFERSEIISENRGKGDNLGESLNSLLDLSLNRTLKDVNKINSIVNDTKVDLEDKPSEKEKKVDNLSESSNSDKKLKEKESKKRKNVINSIINETLADLDFKSPEKKKKKRTNSQSLNSGIDNILSESSGRNKNVEENKANEHKNVIKFIENDKHDKENEPIIKSRTKKKKEKDLQSLNFNSDGSDLISENHGKDNNLAEKPNSVLDITSIHASKVEENDKRDEIINSIINQTKTDLEVKPLEKKKKKRKKSQSLYSSIDIINLCESSGRDKNVEELKNNETNWNSTINETQANQKVKSPEKSKVKRDNLSESASCDKKVEEERKAKKRMDVINSIINETLADLELKSLEKKKRKRKNSQTLISSIDNIFSESSGRDKNVEEEKDLKKHENVIKSIENGKENEPVKSRSKKNKRKDSLGLNFILDGSEIISENQGKDNKLSLHTLEDVKNGKKRNKMINCIVNDTRVDPEDTFLEKEKKVDNLPEPSKSDKNIREKEAKKRKNVINSIISETMFDLEVKSPEKKNKKRKKTHSLNFNNILPESNGRDIIIEEEIDVRKHKTIKNEKKNEPKLKSHSKKKKKKDSDCLNFDLERSEIISENQGKDDNLGESLNSLLDLSLNRTLKDVNKINSIVNDTKVDREDKPSEKEKNVDILSESSNSDKKIKAKESKKRIDVINSIMNETKADLEVKYSKRKKTNSCSLSRRIDSKLSNVECGERADPGVSGANGGPALEKNGNEEEINNGENVAKFIKYEKKNKTEVKSLSKTKKRSDFQSSDSSIASFTIDSSNSNEFKDEKKHQRVTESIEKENEPKNNSSDSISLNSGIDTNLSGSSSSDEDSEVTKREKVVKNIKKEKEVDSKVKSFERKKKRSDSESSNSTVNSSNFDEFKENEPQDESLANRTRSDSQSSNSTLDDLIVRIGDEEIEDIREKKKKETLANRSTKLKYNPLAKELAAMLLKEVTEDDKFAFESLIVNMDWQVAELHRIVPTGTKVPKKAVRDLVDSKIKVKAGPFSAKEDELILSNWKRFYKEHNLSCNPTLFLKLPNFKKMETKLHFLQCLARGMDNRLLGSVYRRFRKMCDCVQQKSGSFTKMEDKMIIDVVGKHHNIRCFLELSKILNRDRIAVERRYRKITKLKKTGIKFTLEFANTFIKNLMKVTKVNHFDELKERRVKYKEWIEMAELMKKDYVRLKRFWTTTLHPKIFVPKNANLVQIRRKIIEILLETKQTDWKVVSWRSVARNFDGFTKEKIYKLFKNLVYVHVPKFKVGNLGECVAHLRDNVLLKENRLQQQYWSRYKFENGELVKDNKKIS